MLNEADEEIYYSAEESRLESNKENICEFQQPAIKRVKYSYSKEDDINKVDCDTSEPLFDKDNKNGEIAISDAPENHLLQVNAKNPFIQIPIIVVLFSQMDQETLKIARQVCHLWNNVSLPIFREKSVAMIEQLNICNHMCSKRNLNGVICSQFLSTMENRKEEEPPFNGLQIENIDMDSTRKMTKVFSFYGCYLTSLVINFRPNDDDIVSGFFFRPVDLKRILFYWCENLKTLELKNLPHIVSEMEEDFFSAENQKSRKPHSSNLTSKVTCLKWNDDRSFFPVAENFVVHLLKSMPLLTKLEIDFEDDESFDAFIDGLVEANKQGYVKNLNSLKFGEGFGCIFYEAHLRNLIAMNLKFLAVEIHNLGQDLPISKVYSIWKEYLKFHIIVVDICIFTTNQYVERLGPIGPVEESES